MTVRVEEWLRQLGLERYEAAFQENEIDGEVLASLTADDLKELGVRALGHRRRLMNAIAELRVGGSSVVLPGVPARADAGRPDHRPGAERRQITIVFCDLVGSTQLSDRLEAEELRELLIGYRDAVTGIIESYEGFVAQYLGDGVLAYFGWPQAHEHDAERAVRASLEMVELVGQLGRRYREKLACRVGIATGPVIVGDLVGSSFSDANQVVGRTPNLAARIQSLARPGTVVISRETRTIIGDRFRMSGTGKHLLKGLGEPVEAWRVDGVREAEADPATRRRGFRLTIVSRRREIERLRSLWRATGAGAGRAVLVSGEAGIGKSRILEEMSRYVTRRNGRVLRYQCSPFHGNEALYPILDQVRLAARGLDPAPGSDDIQRLVPIFAASGLDVTETVALFRSLLPVREGQAPADGLLDARGRKEKTFQALIAIFDWLVGRSQVLVLFEDLHWADPTTHEFLARLIDRIGTQRVLVLFTCRPELSLGWFGRETVESMEVGRLSPEEVQQLITASARGRPIPDDVRAQIAERSDGVPLFAEELVKMVIDSGGLDRHALGVADAFGERGIPMTLRDSLAARLDLLPEARDIVQVASAIGRTFSGDLVAAALGEDPEEVGAGLARLTEARIVTPNARMPRSFVFRHALIRDAAYESMLRTDRMRKHQRIAAALEQHFAAVTPAHVIASHWSMSGHHSAAARYFAEAAATARSLYANAEAAAYYRLALEQVDAAEAEPAGRTERLPAKADLLEDLSGVLVLMHDVDGAVAALTGAIGCVPGTEALRLARLHRLIGVALQQQRQASLDALVRAEAMLAPLDREHEPAVFSEWFDIQLARLNVYYWSGDGEAMAALAGHLTAHVDRGAPAQRAEYYNQMVLRDLRNHRYRPTAATVTNGERYVAAAGETDNLAVLSSAHFILGFVHLHAGNLVEAEQAMVRGLELARRSGHRAIELRCLSYLGLTFRRLRDVGRTEALSAEALAMAKQEKFSEYMALASANLAWASLRRGDTAAAKARVETALAELAESSIAYPFEWCALLPLLALHALARDYRAVPGLCTRLVGQGQQRLPDPLTAAVERVIDAAAPGSGPHLVATALDAMVEAAELASFL